MLSERYGIPMVATQVPRARSPLSSPPNFLFFITDQQRYDHVGYFGNELLQTPNIDKLANTGSWFSRFFVSSPTCMSNRATFMTGRMPSINGVRFNGIPLGLESVTFPDLLSAAGYRNALIGKCHLQGMVEAKSMAPERKWPARLRPPPQQLAEALRSQHSDAEYKMEMQQIWDREASYAESIAMPYYGFDDVSFCLGHGDTVSGHYKRWLAEKASGTVGLGIEHAIDTSAVDAPQVYKPEVAEEFYPTKFVEEKTIDWLQQHAEENLDQPFFVQCSFPDPHHPFTPPGKYWSMYDPNDIELPASFHKPNRDAIPPVRHLWDEYEAGAEHKRWTYPFVTGEAEARDIIAKTFGQISMIDDAIGGVVAALERLGLRENTVICFMSDHGDYLGDHRLMLKGPMHYQSIIRVPFLWSDPDDRYNRGRIDTAGSTLDLARTILSRAGLQPFNGVQGEDLLDILRGETVTKDRRILVETTTQYPYLGFDDLVSVTTLLDGQWRLSVWQGFEWGELYNLENDPDELHNLWSNSAYSETRAKLLLNLVHTIQDHGETSPYPLSVS